MPLTKLQSQLQAIYRRHILASLYRRDVRRRTRWVRNLLPARFADTDLLVVGLVRNEALHVEAFVEHHLHLGARHILLMDNDSTDESVELAGRFPDVSIVRCDCSYATHKYAMYREWPNVVSIQVTETTPIALWKQNGRTFWIDQDGEFIPARATSSGLLLIESELDEPLAEDGYVAEDVLAGALQLRQLRSNIDRLFYEPGNGLSYQDGRGWRAYFGSGLNMEQKLAVYETIVDDLIDQAVVPAYISVRNEAKPFYMPSGG